MMDWMNNLPAWMGGTATASPSNYSTPAPQEWLDQLQAKSGFNPVASGGGIQPGNSLFGGMFDGFLDKTNSNGIKTQGWGGMAMQGLQGLGNSYMGMKQFGLAEDSLKEQKRQFDINFQAQRKNINSQLSDRQLARVASNPTAYQSEAEYMKKWGV